jgi:hypothetical protein
VRVAAGITIFVLASAACGGSTKSDVDSSASAPGATADGTVVTSASQSPSPASPCLHTGRWALCSVEKRLRQAGFVLRPVEGESGARAGFTVKPAVYMLGHARLEVFIYDDEAALSRDLAKMDTLTVAPSGATPSWESQPSLVRSGNLAAVLLTQNQRQAERVMLALTAGAPQPGSPR